MARRGVGGGVGGAGGLVGPGPGCGGKWGWGVRNTKWKRLLLVLSCCSIWKRHFAEETGQCKFVLS